MHGQEKTDYLRLFFGDMFQALIRPLRDIAPLPPAVAATSTATPGASEQPPPVYLEVTDDQMQNYAFILDMLCFLVRVHTQRAKYSMLNDDALMRKIALLFKCRNNCNRLGMYCLAISAFLLDIHCWFL